RYPAELALTGVSQPRALTSARLPPHVPNQISAPVSHLAHPLPPLPKLPVPRGAVAVERPRSERRRLVRLHQLVRRPDPAAPRGLPRPGRLAVCGAAAGRPRLVGLDSAGRAGLA